jgi:signal transduction histidine kinase
VVAGGRALFPNASDNWILVLWIAAAAISGVGMPKVISGARALVRRVLPAADPYSVLKSFVSGAIAAGPVEDALRRLAELLAEGTGVRSAAVWQAGPPGALRRAGSWPDEGQEQPDTVPEAELRNLPGVDHIAPVREGGELLGALTLRARAGHDLALPDVQLAANMANAAGLLLRYVELTDRLRGQVRVETAQEAELAASRRRVVVGRDEAREQLSAEIRAQVCQPLERCGEQVAALSLDESAAGPAQAAWLAEISGEIDAAIADFRRIVHGVYPPVLSDRGLRAAMESLLTDFDPDASLISHRIPRLAAWVEAGIYFCAATLLREWNRPAAPRPVQVFIGVTSTQIGMTFVDNVADGGMGTAADGGAGGGAVAVSPRVLEAVRDRVAAMGGQIKFRRDEAARFLVIEVPLTPADLTTRTAGNTAR